MTDTDLDVALEVMERTWPGYSNAKKIIRDEIVRLRKLAANNAGFNSYEEMDTVMSAAAPVKGE